MIFLSFEARQCYVVLSMTKPAAAIYSRVSLDKQKENFSLPSQRRASLTLAAEKGYRVPKEFEFTDDGFLGGEMDRPAFTRMRAAIRAGLVKAVICYDLDRLVRGLALQMVIEEDCEKYGVELLFVTMPAVQNAEGKMLRQMKGVFAEYEKAKIRDRTTGGRRQKALAGHVSGRAPFGFKYVGKKAGSRGELVVEPEQAKVVRRIFKMADHGVKLLDIARRLTEDGVRTATGRPWSKTVLSGMLRNTVYVGVSRHNRNLRVEPKLRRKAPMPGKSKKTSARTRPASEWISVTVPAILDRALFDRVHERMTRDRHINSGRPSPFILRGLIKCGACGFACKVGTNGSRKKCYRCGNLDRLTYGRKCQQPSVLVAEIEGVVWNTMLDTLEDPARVWELMTGQWEALAKTDKQLAKERAVLTATIEKLKVREFRTRQAMQDADLQAAWAGFRDDLKTILSQRRAQESRLAQLQPVERPAFDLDRYCKMVDGWRKLKAPEPRREALRQVVERVELRDHEVTVHFRLGGSPATNCINSQPAAGARRGSPAGARDSRRARCRAGPHSKRARVRKRRSGADRRSNRCSSCLRRFAFPDRARARELAAPERDLAGHHGSGVQLRNLRRCGPIPWTDYRF